MENKATDRFEFSPIDKHFATYSLKNKRTRLKLAEILRIDCVKVLGLIIKKLTKKRIK